MTMSRDPCRVHIRVSGRVQGVGFRQFVQQQADSFDLTGWVRNLVNGGVEIMAEGRKEDLATFIDRVRVGPELGHVSDLDIEWLLPVGNYRYFMVAPSE